jgi:MarR family transcriptional regulator, lower aerobic nicotinate degradation pathway regulator
VARSASLKKSQKPARPVYILDEQIGFLLRQVWQRHAAIFARDIGINLTSAQWAALSKLNEVGPCSQNRLGRLTAMDAATIKGVIDRLNARGFTRAVADAEDARRRVIELTPAGAEVFARAEPIAHEITEQTLAPLDEDERRAFLALLRRLA